MDDTWVLLEKVEGMPLAELMGSLLEAQNVPVYLNQEGAGQAMGLTVGRLGEVEVLVPSQQLQTARQVIDAYYNSHATLADDEEIEIDLDDEPSDEL
jgi:hypothetical protein